MSLSIKRISLLTSALAILGLVTGYRLAPGFWQDVAVGMGTTFFGLGLAVLVVNYALTSADKKLAARPVFKLIMPNATRLHNELLIVHMQGELGKDQFESLVELYTKHGGNPRAFSPEQRDVFFGAIEKIRPDLEKVYETLQEQLRELTMLLGWSFDSTITSAGLDARMSIATFKAATWDNSDDSKRSIIEAYLDADGAIGAVVTALSKHLELKAEDWQQKI